MAAPYVYLLWLSVAVNPQGQRGADSSVQLPACQGEFVSLMGSLM